MEFKHGVVTKLTRDRSGSAAIFAMANMPSRMIFEMTRGKEKLRVERTEGELSVVQEFAPTLEEVVKKANDADELQELADLLKATLADIERSKKKRTL